MSIANNSVLRVVLSLLLPDNVIAQNVFYVLFEDTGASNDDQDVVDDVSTWVEAAYTYLDGYIPAVVSLTGTKVYIYDTVGEDWDEVGDGSAADNFAGATEMLPHGVAAVIHAKTTNPDVQATKYIPGMAEGNQNSSVWNGGTLAALVNWAVEWTEIFVGAETGGDFGPGVWSPTHEIFYHFRGVEVINAIAGYQRRRKPGVGI